MKLFSQPPTMNYRSVTLLVGVWFTSLLDASLLDIVVYEERMFDVLITCLEEELSTGIVVIVCEATGIVVIVCEATGIVDSVCEVRSAEDVFLKVYLCEWYKSYVNFIVHYVTHISGPGHGSVKNAVVRTQEQSPVTT